MEEREAKLLAKALSASVRPCFMALITVLLMQSDAVRAEQNPDKVKVLPRLEYQRQADALLLEAEAYQNS